MSLNMMFSMSGFGAFLEQSFGCDSHSMGAGAREDGRGVCCHGSADDLMPFTSQVLRADVEDLFAIDRQKCTNIST